MMLSGRIWCSVLVVAFTLIMTSAFASPGVESQADTQSGEKDAAESFTFRVRIQNMAPEREMPTLFSPGVWVLHSEAGPIFAKAKLTVKRDWKRWPKTVTRLHWLPPSSQVDLARTSSIRQFAPTAQGPFSPVNSTNSK